MRCTTYVGVDGSSYHSVDTGALIHAPLRVLRRYKAHLAIRRRCCALLRTKRKEQYAARRWFLFLRFKYDCTDAEAWAEAICTTRERHHGCGFLVRSQFDLSDYYDTSATTKKFSNRGRILTSERSAINDLEKAGGCLELPRSKRWCEIAAKADDLQLRMISYPARV